jgi:DNA-binding transcriptional MerR regulator
VPFDPEELQATEVGLDGLVALAGRLLAEADARATDGRVSLRPDARTIRYYQSLGLADRPIRYEGRRAIYGYRHLLQVLCVKLLQASGYSLAQSQRALSGSSTRDLEQAVVCALQDGAAWPPASPRPPVAPPVRGSAEPLGLRARGLSDAAAEAKEEYRVSGPAFAGARPLVSAELAPGVWATVDPELVDCERTIARLARAVRPSDGGSE